MGIFTRFPVFICFKNFGVRTFRVHNCNMDIDSLYNWSCKKLNIIIPRNKISEILFEKVLRLRKETLVNGRRLNSYSQEFQNLDTLEQWIKLLINFYEEMELCNPNDYYIGHYKQYIKLWVELSKFYEENNFINLLILKEKCRYF